MQVKQFEGMYLLFRRKGNTMTRKYAGTPRFRHHTREKAEKEAERLLALFPDSTFVIIQEVGICKRD